MSCVNGSMKGSKDIGRFLGNRYEGTKPNTYTSSTWQRYSFDIVAKPTSKAPRKHCKTMSNKGIQDTAAEQYCSCYIDYNFQWSR